MSEQMAELERRQREMDRSGVDRLIERENILLIVESEPEYPDPCPNLRARIAQAVSEGDSEWILHMMRQVARQTKESIAERIRARGSIPC